MNIIAHGAFVAIDHPGRAYLALAVYFRHAGLSEEELSPRLRELATTRMLDRARVLGAAMRVAYILTAGQGGVLPKTPMAVKARPAGADAARQIARARRRAARPPDAPAGEADRARSGDRGLTATSPTRSLRMSGAIGRLSKSFRAVVIGELIVARKCGARLITPGNLCPV